jgi:hypothetical protein
MNTMLAELVNIPGQALVPDVDTSGPRSFIVDNLWLLLVAGGLAYALMRMWKNAAMRTLLIVVMVGALTYWITTQF